MRADQERAARSFHEANPEVYERLVALTRKRLSRGKDWVSIKMLWEVLRWDWEGAPLNNNYHAWYAREMMRREADLRGVFRVRNMCRPDLARFE